MCGLHCNRSNSADILNIIFQNTRTSSAATALVAVLNGNEAEEDLNLLPDDTQLYFGMGCRNVTKIFVLKIMIFALLDA
jgi:hypothetical protein